VALAEPQFERAPVAEGLRRYGNVMGALLLHDLKSRYFGSVWGYLITLGWPLVHMAVLLVINFFLNRMQPYGDSVVLWFATGIVPFLAFSYIARFTSLGLLLNAPLLSFPVVKTMDIIIARVIVEVLSAAVVFVTVYICLLPLDVDFIPNDVPMAFAAVAIGLLNGIGLGILMSLLSRLSVAWNVAGVLLLIVLWGISGVMFVPSQVPAIARDILALNPVMHSVSMYRAAYYEGYAADWIDVAYSVKFGVALLALALVTERVLRGRLRE
jgi:capsular polysaccharide transport system permease protein